MLDMKLDFKKSLWKHFLLFLIVFNLFVGSWYVLNSDIYFHSDIGRDFLILREIEAKKVVLIGARTGAAGVYHGVFWYYLMFPVYYFSGGNPVAVGWFWVFLVAIFLVLGFKVAKSLFSEPVAYLYTVFVSGYLMLEANSFSHPAGTILVAPFFIFFFYKYVSTLKVSYLAISVILAGLLVHLELVVGIPFLLLSFAYTLLLTIRKKKLKHLLVFLLIFVMLSTYIAFELRHNFLQLKHIVGYIAEGRHVKVNIFDFILQRINYIPLTGIPLVRDYGLNRILLFIVIPAFLMLFRGQKKNAAFYSIALYFFCGFFLISFISPYLLLRHHFIAFIPVAFLLLASVAFVGRGKWLLPIFAFAILVNEIGGVNFILKSNGIIGKGLTSWKFYNQMTQEVFSKNDKEFGYFVFSPDKFAYQGKYAMYYAARHHPSQKALSAKKMPITYLVMAPPPPPPDDKLELTGPFWKNNTIQIKKEANWVMRFDNGYVVERLSLTPGEVNTPFNAQDDPGLLFR